MKLRAQSTLLNTTMSSRISITRNFEIELDDESTVSVDLIIELSAEGDNSSAYKQIFDMAPSNVTDQVELVLIHLLGGGDDDEDGKADGSADDGDDGDDGDDEELQDEEVQN
jgi:hypothetical protein